MPARIVVFGATGYTGRLVAEQLVAQDVQPLLAARSELRLAELAERLGGLEHRVADVGRPDSVAALAGPGDVLLSTVGPFKRWGEPAVAAAVGAGGVYLDSTGEPGFIRRVFDVHDGPARRAGATLLPALGYDFVPGALAGALALEAAARGEAGDEASGRGGAVRVDVGYYALGGSTASLSAGTKASMAGVALDPAFAFRGGRIVTVRSAERVRSFAVRGKDRPAVSVGGAEHFGLPAAYPQLREINVYLGWFGPASRVARASSAAGAVLTRVPGVRGLLERASDKLGTLGGPGPEPGTTPGTTSHIAAIAYDGAGQPAAEVHVAGADAYDFTARFLAWAARRAADGGVAVTGAAGPLAAFGLDALREGCAAAGIEPV